MQRCYSRRWQRELSAGDGARLPRQPVVARLVCNPHAEHQKRVLAYAHCARRKYTAVQRQWLCNVLRYWYMYMARIALAGSYMTRCSTAYRTWSPDCGYLTRNCNRHTAALTWSASPDELRKARGMVNQTRRDVQSKCRSPKLHRVQQVMRRSPVCD